MPRLTALLLDPIFGANEILNLMKCQICLYCLFFFLARYLYESRKEIKKNRSEIKQLLECSTQMLERSTQRLERVRRMAEELERESEELAQENNNLAQENNDIAKNDCQLLLDHESRACEESVGNDDGSFTSEWDTDEKYNEELSESEHES
jgi:cell division protein FtsB